MAEAPAGFVLGPQGLYENPETGEWIDPDTGIIYAENAPPPDSGQSSGAGSYGGPASGATSTLAAQYLIGDEPAAAAAATAPAAAAATSAAIPIVAPSTVASGIPAAASGYPATEAIMSAAPTAETLATPITASAVSEAAAPTVLGSTTAGAALPYLGYPAGAYTGYQQAMGIKDLAQQKKPGLIESAAMFPLDGGATLGAKLLSKIGIDVPWGHSKNYYAGKDRSKMLQAMIGDAPSLDFTTDSGGQISITPTQFRKDPTTYNYDQASPGMEGDIGIANALAYLDTGEADSNQKRNTDLGGLYANLHRQGVSTQSLLESRGWDHDRAYGQVHLDYLAGKISKQRADELKNGLDQAAGVGFYANGNKPRLQSSYTSPSNSNSSSSGYGDNNQLSQTPSGFQGSKPPNPQQAAAWQAAVDNGKKKVSTPAKAPALKPKVLTYKRPVRGPFAHIPVRGR